MVMEVSPEKKKNGGKFASRPMGNNAVSRHFFFSSDTPSPNKQIKKDNSLN
jgi:hypothetical protein